MKTKIIVTLIFILALVAGGFYWQIHHKGLRLNAVEFNRMPGWKEANTVKSLRAFNISCKYFLKQKPDTPVGSPYIPLTAADWQPACKAALLVNPRSKKETKAFFEQWFTPVEFFNNKPVKGLFTGYYLPLLHGSLTKTTHYNVPLYNRPKNMITVNAGLFDPSLTNRRFVGRLKDNQLVPYFSREEINNGAIDKSTSVIAWVNSHVDRLFLEIQGSGIIELPNGSRMIVGYAGQNGAPYTAIGRVLIEQGVMTKENTSMQSIREYLESHPELEQAIINQNKSFVFFEKSNGDSAVGVQGIVLIPGYSLAVDRKWIPIGSPIWLNTTRPHHQNTNQTTFQRLMIAQDTGGAIRGMVRGDVFWGAGDKATEIAGKMKNSGYYWLLLPKQALKDTKKRTKKTY